MIFKIINILSLIFVSCLANDVDYHREYKSTEIANEAKKIEIPVCCPPGYILRASKCQNTSEIIQPNLPLIYNEQLQVSEKNQNIFHYHYGMPCADVYALNPDSPDYDIFYLLENGTIYQDNSAHGIANVLLNIDNYCFANIIDINGNFSTVVGVCYPSDVNEVESKKLIIFPIAMIMSTVFLVLTFLVYALLPELKNIHGMTLMAYVTSLLIAYILLAVVQLDTLTIYGVKNLCATLAFIIHFSFLASFFWLNVMCFDIWWTFGGFRSLQGSVKQRERKKFMIYSIYAWGCASFFTGICLIMDFVPSIPTEFIRPQFGVISCWFMTDAARALYFYAPMGVTILCNISLFISTAMKILQHKKDTSQQLKGMDSHRHDDSTQWFNLYLKLFIVMGINWSMEIVSWLCKGTPEYVWYVTDMANTLQGVIIFIIFVWKPKIKRLLLKRFGYDNSEIQSRNSTKSACPSSTSRTYTTTVNPHEEHKMTSYNVGKNSTAITTDESDGI